MNYNATEYLKSLNESSVWVFTKQETNFDDSILATKLFDEIPDKENTNIEQYFIDHHNEYNLETDRHRILVIPQLFGLLTKTPFYQRGVQYSKERPTAVYDSFNKIIEKINEYGIALNESKEYNTLKTEQILKLKIHALIDTADNNQGYNILPVIFIYKVLKILQQEHNINQITIDQLYTYVMTCKSYKDIDRAVYFIRTNAPISAYVREFKGLSRVLTLIKKNTNLFNITRESISINQKFDTYFDVNFMQKYDFDDLNEILLRDVDYSYFLYNVQDFNINLIDEPDANEEYKYDSLVKQIIKLETEDNENDQQYEEKVDEIKEDNINKDVAIGAHKVAPQVVDEKRVSSKYKRNPLLGKIAIQNAYYCCEKNAHHETFISEKTNKNFMEAHHLVPVKFQQEIWKKYGVNVDCVENILSLCPICHRAFHNGTDEVKSKMIDAMYEIILPRYKSINFNITVSEIKSLYGIK